MKKIATVLIMPITILCICFMLPSSILAADDVIPNDETGIPDKGLYQAILQELEKGKKETFTKEEAEEITELSVNYLYEVKTLKGIGCLTNLKELMFSSEYCSQDVLNEMAEELPQLESLLISNINMERIQFPASMTNLKSLEMRYDKLVNLDGIGSLVNLEHLDVDDNRLADISALKNLKHLRYLSLNHNRLSSLKGIEGLAGLKFLNVEFNNLTNLKGIEGLGKLEYLNASNNRLSSLRELKSLRNLKDLSCSNNYLKSIKELKNLKKLYDLTLCWNQLTNVDVIRNLKSLYSIDLDHNRIKKLPNLKKLKKLHSIEIYGNALTQKEIDAKLPKRARDYIYRENQEKYQRQNFAISFIKPSKKSKITKNTKTITGRVSAQYYKENVGVSLYSQDDYLGSAKIDKDGRFVLKGLKLKKYAGQEIYLVVTTYPDNMKDGWKEVNRIAIKVKK